MAISSSNDITVLSQSFEPLAKKPKITSATPIVDTWVDKLTLQQKENYDTLLANLFYRTGIPFQVIDSFAMKEFIKAVRPAYVTQMPSRKSLSGHLLDKAYGILKQKFDTWMNESKFYSIVTNGWSNTRNDHIVNYIVIVPGKKPLFYKSIDTSNVPQTAENIAKELFEVIDELGSEKLLSVVSDNAICMKKALDKIEEKYPLVFANGCAAHTMNLLVKDICDIEENNNVLNQAVQVVRYIKERHIVLAKYREIKANLRVEKQICLPVITRWYSRYNCAKSLLDNKGVISLLAIDGVIEDVRSQQAAKRDSFLGIVRDPQFWEGLSRFIERVEYPTKIIGKFERDSADLSCVYSYFLKLTAHYATFPAADKKLYTELVEKRWNFIHTESMGFSFILTPRNTESSDMVGTDRLDTIQQLRKYAKNLFVEENADVAFNRELNNFLSQFTLMDPQTKKEYFEMTPFQYWTIYGRNDFPMLQKIALRIFNVPISNASSERAWSTFDFIHTKKRNRLLNEKVKKLVFIYTNSALLDSDDPIDYLVAPIISDSD